MAGKRDNKGKTLTGQALKEFRKNQAILYKKGLAKFGANKQRVTKYAIQKQKKLAPIIKGEAIAIKTPKEIRKQYSEKNLFREFGGRLIVPKEQSSQAVKIRKGLITLITPLKNGQEEKVIFPVNVTDMQDVVRELKRNGDYANMLQPGEAFGFRLFGHNSTDVFPDVQELIDHIELRYKHLFNPDNAEQAFKNFVLVRFAGRMKEGPESEKLFTRKERRVDATGRNTVTRNEYTKSQAARRQKAYRERLKKNPDRYNKVLAADRRRKAIKRES
jgi:hypothetical protein